MKGHDAQARALRRGFTIVEVLVTFAIMGLLLAVALPTLARTLAAARAFRCQVSQRSVAFDFSVFATDGLSPDRGRDEAYGRRFQLETFQESQYGVDEFWRYGDIATHMLPDAAKNDPMRCPEVREAIVLRRDRSCSDGAVTPPSAISFGFNLRLHKQVAAGSAGDRVEIVYLSESILQAGQTPLFWDVNGAAAARKDANPVFSAPSLGEVDMTEGDRYWFPGQRHDGAANFAFIDGHVESSRNPLSESGWTWKLRRGH